MKIISNTFTKKLKLNKIKIKGSIIVKKNLSAPPSAPFHLFIFNTLPIFPSNKKIFDIPSEV